jgi:large subunit ribosomal protein L10Ae
MSKVDSQLLSESIDKILAFSKGEEVEGVKGKKRGFLETVELQVSAACAGLHPMAELNARHGAMQVSLRNYDPNKDKRFTGTFRLPVVPRPKMTVCVLGTEAHVSEAKTLELGALVRSGPRDSAG